jgi:hypothetical protein
VKPEAFVENIMLRGLVRSLADALEHELQRRYKDVKGHHKLESLLEREMELVRIARKRLEGREDAR